MWPPKFVSESQDVEEACCLLKIVVLKKDFFVIVKLVYLFKETNQESRPTTAPMVTF
jgi:hypothetical protein